MLGTTATVAAQATGPPNDWENPAVIGRNREPPHATYTPYPDRESALRGVEGRAYRDWGHLLGVGNTAVAKTIISELDRCGLLP